MVNCTQPLPLSDLNTSNDDVNDNNNLCISVTLYRMEFIYIYIYIFNFGVKEPVAIYSRLFSILKNNAIYGN